MPELAPLPALHMVQLNVSSRDLMRSAKVQNIPERAGDMGYVLHGQLAALFGDLAPKPFHAVERSGSVTVLGYSDADSQSLREQVDTFANPNDARALRDLATKTMPSTWATGRRLGFEVRVCPTIRREKQELDAYIQATEKLSENEDRPPREPIYCQWLARKLEGAAELKSCRLHRFQLIRLFRRYQRQGGGRRPSQPRFPEAVLHGELQVTDGEAFARLLARGVGRHRAFGFGMLLLRPPSRP